MSLESRATHWAWMLRKRRAQVANFVGRPFTYEHQVIGRFIYHPSDDLSRHVLLYDFEPAELRFAIEHARAGGITLDVGANIGVFTVACARAASSRGRVVALEPAPATYAKLRVTCARLGLANVEALPLAAARANGRATFIVDGVHELRQHLADARDDRQHIIEVETRRLDDVCGDRASDVTLVKVDVEGHELDALSGATRILQNGRAHLIVEFYPRALEAAGASVDALRQFLSKTHVCTAIVRPDGTVDDGAGSVVVEPPHETLNTFWAPCRPPKREPVTAG